MLQKVVVTFDHLSVHKLVSGVRFCWCLLRLCTSPQAWQVRDRQTQDLTWIAKVFWLLEVWWRCRSFDDLCWCVEGWHRKPKRALEWSDSALWYSLYSRGTLNSKIDRYCSYCRSKGESDPWWERPDPSVSSWAIRLHMQLPSHPYIWPLCSKERWLVASFYSRILPRCRGRK